MVIDLKFPASGSVTHQVTLPAPAPGVTVDVETNQEEYRTPARNLFTVKRGPTLYRVTRNFEALTEQQSSELFAFFEAVDFCYQRLRYCYTDVASGSSIEVVCWLMEAPTEMVVHRNNRDVVLKFEQYSHPDAETEGRPVLAMVDGAYFAFTDGALLRLGGD